MSYQPTQIDLKILQQSNQEIYVKLDLLNKDFKSIDSLQGEMIDGSHAENAESDIRTTSNITLFIKDSSYLTGSDRKIWIDKYVRLYIGILYQRTQEILWYPMGVFLFNENSYTYDATTKTLSINLLDLMSKLTGVRNGQVKGLSHTIASGTDIRTAMISCLSEGVEISNYIIEDIKKTVPYNLEFSTGSTVYNMITELRDLYAGWETYFDDTTFVCKKIPTCIDDNIVLDADTIFPLVISENLSNVFSDVKNVTDVWGKCIDCDKYAEISTVSGNQYNITLTDYTLDYGDLIGFKTTTAVTTPTLKINSETAYSIVDSKDVAVALEANKSYVVKYINDKFLYQGQFQIHAIVKEFSAEPNDTYKTQDIINEGTKNIKYIINADSPYCVDKIGEIRQVLSGDEYENIYTEELCMQRAEYENWKATRLQDNVSLNMIIIPWLHVNQKISYKSKITNETQQYIIKSINRSFNSWTMTIEMIKFYPLYPYIVS